MKASKSPKPGTEKTAPRAPEGFFEPFAIDDVPWRNTGGRSRGGAGIVRGRYRVPDTGKARVRATAKIILIPDA